jgi:nitrite reductase/ring-hydroxylating ferredoxin subunit
VPAAASPGLFGVTVEVASTHGQGRTDFRPIRPTPTRPNRVPGTTRHCGLTPPPTRRTSTSRSWSTQDFVSIDGPVGVYRDDDGGFQAVSAVCTHLNCVANWNGATQSWDCPCHRSRFDLDDSVVDTHPDRFRTVSSRAIQRVREPPGRERTEASGTTAEEPSQGDATGRGRGSNQTAPLGTTSLSLLGLLTLFLLFLLSLLVLEAASGLLSLLL